ncbi:MAG: hypothetical protein ACK458_08620 [Sphingobacteriales bacterium]|jgi:hypothetical protein
MEPGHLEKAIPVLPSQDIARDEAWYKEKLGLQTYFADSMYAVMYRDNIVIHLQWHADTPDDPLLGGSVVRFITKDIQTIFREMIQRGTVTEDALRENTPWGTHEFGVFDLNRNLIFIIQDI